MKVETVGQASWPRRVRRFFVDLLGSDYVRLLERDLLQSRLERDRALTELKACQERMFEVMAVTKGIPYRAPIVEAKKPSVMPKPTRWQEVQAAAILENARLEESEAPKEN